MKETPQENITESYKCTAITTNLLMSQEWLPIDCDRKFENMTFICEFPGK